MFPITYIEVNKAAKKSKQAALENCIKKYIYLATCTYSQFNNIRVTQLKDTYCALCERYANNTRWKCPLLGDFCKLGVNCIPEWRKMYDAYRNSNYVDFQLYASTILVKLLKLAGKI